MYFLGEFAGAVCGALLARLFVRLSQGRATPLERPLLPVSNEGVATYYDIVLL